MKKILMTALLLSGLAGPVMGEVLHTITGEDLAQYRQVVADSAISVSYEELDGSPVLRVTCASEKPASHSLFKVPLNTPAGRNLLVTAELQAEDVKESVYLETWCFLSPDRAFFSRALDTALTGSTGWTRHRAPSLLQEDQVPQAVSLGVRFEGPGTVLVRNFEVALEEKGLAGLLQRPGAAGGLLGAAIGILGGLWGALTGALVPRGKGKGFVLGSGLVLLGTGVLLATTGLWLYLSDASRDYGYACLLSGGILTPLMILLLPGVMRQYRMAEERRMQQLDAGGSL
jgi:hypothetical protein